MNVFKLYGIVGTDEEKMAITLRLVGGKNNQRFKNGRDEVSYALSARERMYLTAVVGDRFADTICTPGHPRSITTLHLPDRQDWYFAIQHRSKCFHPLSRTSCCRRCYHGMFP